MIENEKLADGPFNVKSAGTTVKSVNSNEVDALKRQIRLLEDKLRQQQQQKRNVAEKPYVDEEAISKARSKSPKHVTIQNEANEKASGELIAANYALKNEIEQWRTRYNYVLSENAILSRQNGGLENQVRACFLLYFCGRF